ncbi:DUF742 domain-containing protein [Streptomyces sp. NPDC017260]|uniref:DUF742 domain-containing protein n=1 Tax=unclassified Streptomyces TaxID=2593676 RepID=UPI0037B9B606
MASRGHATPGPRRPGPPEPPCCRTRRPVPARPSYRAAPCAPSPSPGPRRHRARAATGCSPWPRRSARASGRALRRHARLPGQRHGEKTRSVAELAADADLPVGVVRVLLGDLVELGSVIVSRPVPPARLPDERVLREVIDGLRAL